MGSASLPPVRSDPDDQSVRQPRKQKLPRKITPSYLENSAVFYLRRYASSSANLKRVMLRKIDRSLKVHGGERSEATAWLDEVIAKLTRAALIDDDAYARMKVSSLRRKGASTRGVRAKLQQKGVPSKLIDQELVASGGSELDAAQAYAKRRRLGPFRMKPSTHPKQREKDLAAMARAGFPYGLSKGVIDGKGQG